MLIVIGIIAILAAISIVAYNGIQQKAKNVAIISAASQSLQMIQAYRTLTGEYPAHGSVCITYESGCSESGGEIDPDADFTNNIASVGTLPSSVPSTGDDRYGIIYSHNPSRIFDGEPRRVLIYYYLNGVEQQCGLSGVANDWWLSGGMDPSSTGYTVGNSGGSGKTVCVISVPL